MHLDNPEIEIFGVYDRGIPNQERIVLRTYNDTNLSHYFLILGFTVDNLEVIFPVTDQFLWLGNMVVAKDSWIFVYTGIGLPAVTREMNTNDPVHNIFWNKKQVILGTEDLMPAIVSFGKIVIGSKTNKIIADLKNQTTNPLLKTILESGIKKIT